MRSILVLLLLTLTVAGGASSKRHKKTTTPTTTLLSPPPTAPTPVPTASVLENWKQLFKDTDGGSWTACSGDEHLPCSCGRVKCNKRGTVIEQLNLAGLGLKGV